MVRGTIQALEVQRGTLAALKSMGDAFAKAARAAGRRREGSASGDKRGAAAAPFADPALWWNMLQDQFKQAVTTAMSPEAMAEATARAQEAAGQMAAAMPAGDMGKAMADSMTKAGDMARRWPIQWHGGAQPGDAKPRAAKPRSQADRRFRLPAALRPIRLAGRAVSASRCCRRQRRQLLHQLREALLARLDLVDVQQHLASLRPTAPRRSRAAACATPGSAPR